MTYKAIETLVRMYLRREEGIINLTIEEVDMNVIEGIKTYGSLDLFRSSLITYLQLPEEV